jgi:hypothetical protein
MSAGYKLTDATLRIGGRAIPLKASVEVSEVAPGERLPLGEPWSFGPVAVPVNPKLAADILALTEALRRDRYSVIEGPFCLQAVAAQGAKCHE